MPLFRDVDGNFFDIPDEVLQKYRVEGELPEGALLSGGMVGQVGGAGYQSLGASASYSPHAAYSYAAPEGAAYAASASMPSRGPAYNWPGQAAYNYTMPSRGPAYNYPDAAAYNYPHSVPSRGPAYNWPGQAAYNYAPPAYSYPEQGSATHNYPAPSRAPAYNYAHMGGAPSAEPRSFSHRDAASYNYEAATGYSADPQVDPASGALFAEIDPMADSDQEQRT